MESIELVGTYYEDLGITTYSINALNASVTALYPNFPEGTTWYIEDDTYTKVDAGSDDKIDEIIKAATKAGYGDGSITLDFSKSTFTELDAGFCPTNVTSGKISTLDTDFNALGSITGLGSITSILAWSIRNMKYLKIVEGLSNVTGTLGNYCFYYLPALESITLGITGFGSDSFIGCTELDYIDLPNVTVIGSNHFTSSTPSTLKLTTDTEISSLAIGCTTATCDLYLSSVNYVNAVDTDGVITWGGKTWRSITNNDNTSQYLGTRG